MEFEMSSDTGYIHQESREYSLFHSDIYPNNPQQQREQAVIPTSFFEAEYPTDFSHANPFCPICGIFIPKSQEYLQFLSALKRKKYLIHLQCASEKEGESLFMVDSQQAKLQSIAFLPQNRSLSLGGKQFYIEVEVFHPLGLKKNPQCLAKLWTKLMSIGNLVTWDFKSSAEGDFFSPNIVAFPFPDFELSISLFELGEKQGKITKKALVSVGRLGGRNEVQLVKAYTNEIEITMRVIGSKEDKVRTIDQMNLKYKYPLQTGTPLIEIVRVQVKIPSEDSDEEDEELSRGTIHELNSEKTSQRDGRSAYNSEALSERSFDRQKVDLQKLIISEKLGDFVRQNTQSRVFQSWLGQASPRQIDQVISNLLQELPDLITHEYANYMIQKLIGVCSQAQRIRVVTRIQADIPGIARNKQGTHSLQTLIALFTSEEEFKLVIDSIKTSFLPLAQHPNATHFLQKAISLFPLRMISCFMETVIHDFLSYALDKHAMCVIKQMIKKVQQSESQKDEELANQLRKRFLHSVVNFNIDKLIGDPYGNYILQFCYEFFGESKCGAITQRIIAKILPFSLQKYSSAVIVKCLTSFWSQKQTFDLLRNALTPQVIQEMFKNKDANKILLEVVQRNESSPLGEKILGQLMLGQLTKFNHERWGIALGPRSGTVGWTSGFPSASKKVPKKRKKYNNDR